MIIKYILTTFVFKNYAFQILILTCLSLHMQAQEKKQMTPEVYSEWNKIKNTAISDTGNTVIYTLEREFGNKVLKIYNTISDSTFSFDRASEPALDRGGDFVLFRRGLDADSLKQLKRKKTPAEKLPSDSLYVYQISNDTLFYIPSIESFKTPVEYGGFVAFQIKATEEVADSIKTKPKSDKKKEPKSYDLIIKDLNSHWADTIINVTEYLFCEEGKKLAAHSTGKDSTVMAGVFVINLDTKIKTTVLDSKSKISQLNFDKYGDQLAFYVETDTTSGKSKSQDLYLWTAFRDSTVKIADNNGAFLPADWLMNKNKKPEFSENGRRLFFGISPKPLEKDTSLLDDEIVNVEVWHHNDPKIHTQQETLMELELKRTYKAYIDLADSTFMAVENEHFNQSMISLKGDGRYALLLSDTAYQKQKTWDITTIKDIFLKDLSSGRDKIIATGQAGSPQFSPGGQYVFWYDQKDTLWKAYHIANEKLIELTPTSLGTFYDELNDVPAAPDSYGFAGWTEGDEQIIIYDRYDLWMVNPQSPDVARKVTDGRKDKMRHRYIKLNKKEDFISRDTLALLRAFNEIDKSEAYVSLDLRFGEMIQLYGGPFSLSLNITKATSNNNIIFTYQNFQTFPDLQLTDLTFQEVKRVSDANPQQADYTWGSGSLFSWTNYNGNKNDGMLFFPPDFNPENKYPLIVNFYERSSDDLNRHRAPEAHRSTINYTYYTNKGYVIFNPDIHYTIGYPGQSAYDAVMSGVDALLEYGYIDTARMALQGHSWGGYQIAHILTKTNRFKCAESGAPVVNMISAYGGIRWESGLSRMFQYEMAQSRIGESLWDNPILYLENSPIFSMYNVNTPVLILHNDADGAVPWYQGIEYYMALRRLGKECWLLNYNGEPHWPVKWQNRLDFNIRMEQFFDHYLLDKPMPLWMKEGISPIEKGILKKY
ncbi:MAG: S9 family peptidase [Saprospiraceae bacterium]|nr:S9 family peptidase [Saprospiraceae bacterium]